MADEFGAAPAPRPSGERPAQPGALCTPFVEQLPVSGASISVFDEAGHQSTICASDRTAARLEELQFELGEGPHWEALRTARPVLVNELSEGRKEWPMFAAAALELDAGALFAFPMVMGAVTVGVVDLYCVKSGALDAQDVAAGVALTHLVTLRAVRRALHSAGDDASAEVADAPAMRREVHQATGMILVQLDSSATEAFSLLRARAFASSRTVQDVAHDVVTRVLDFSDLRD